MRSSEFHLWFFAAVIATVFGGGLLSQFSPDVCAFSEAGSGAHLGTCAEFWVNRYQGLAGGLLTIVAAFIAGHFVLKQTEVAQKQLSVSLGDVPPVFWLERKPLPSSDPDVRVYLLTCENINSRMIVIHSIELIEPACRTFNVLYNSDFLAPLHANKKSTSIRVLGRDLREGRAQGKSVDVWVHGFDQNTSKAVAIEIGYIILSATPEEHRTIVKAAI